MLRVDLRNGRFLYCPETMGWVKEDGTDRLSRFVVRASEVLGVPVSS